jgi:hypothetical protein
MEASSVDLKGGSITGPSSTDTTKAKDKKAPLVKPSPLLKKEEEKPEARKPLIKPLKTNPTAPAPFGEPLLQVQDVYLKGNTLHVKIRNTGKGTVSAAEYSKAKLYVEPRYVKIPWSWTLMEVDPKRSSFKREVDFDTGKALEETTPLRVWIQGAPSGGEWKGTLTPKIDLAIRKKSASKAGAGKALVPGTKIKRHDASPVKIDKTLSIKDITKDLKKDGMLKSGATLFGRTRPDNLVFMEGDPIEQGIRILSPTSDSRPVRSIGVQYEILTETIPSTINIWLVNRERNESFNLYWGAPHPDGQEQFDLTRYNIEPGEGWHVSVSGSIDLNRTIRGQSPLFPIGWIQGGGERALDSNNHGINVSYPSPGTRLYAGETIDVHYDSGVWNSYSDPPARVRIGMFRESQGMQAIQHELHCCSSNCDPDNPACVASVNVPADLEAAEDWIILVESLDENPRRWGTSCRLVGRSHRGGPQGVPSPPTAYDSGIRITSPSEGQIVYSGEMLDIQYEFSEIAAYEFSPNDRIKVELLNLNHQGPAWYAFLDERTPHREGHGNIQVRIPTDLLPDQDYRIQIMLYRNNSVTGFDGISACFALTHRYYVPPDACMQFVYPAGGEYFRAGQRVEIQFEAGYTSYHHLRGYLFKGSTPGDSVLHIAIVRFAETPEAPGRAAFEIPLVPDMGAVDEGFWLLNLELLDADEAGLCSGYSPAFRIGP